MGEKFFSIIIVPHSKEGSKSFTISKKAIKASVGTASFLILVFIAFIFDYFSMNISRQKYKDLYSENLNHKVKIAGYENSIRKFKQTIEDFDKYTKKLNVMAGLKSPDVLKEVGIGGSDSSGVGELSTSISPPNLTSSNIQSITQKAEDIDKNLNTLVNFFENQSARLASTPTIWPTAGWVISTFGMRKDPFTEKQAFHYGIDIATNSGNPVMATANGVVVRLKNDKSSGMTILLSHGGGFTTLYYHLSKFLVKTGQKVKRGDVIGLVGKTGRALGPHVHYEIRINDKPINPYNYILEEN